MAKRAVNGWFADLVSSAAEPIFDTLRRTVLGTPELDSPEMARARELWGVSQTIANTCYVLLITVGGVWLMAGHNLPGAELTPGQLVVRIVGAFLASNLSLILIGHGISFANGLAGAFLRAGAEATDPGVVADVVTRFVAASLVPGSPFGAIVALVVVVLAVGVVFVYIIRLALTMVLIAAAPLALMFHALPLTDGLARLWWRGMSGLLAIQVCQALALSTAYRLLFTKTEDGTDRFLGLPSHNDFTNLLVAACLLWLLLRIPSWVARRVWQPTQPRMFGGVLRSLIIYRGLGALLGRRRGVSTAATASFAQLPPVPPPVPHKPDPRPPLALPAGPAGPPPPATPPPPSEPDAPENGPEGDPRPMQLALPIPNPPAPTRPGAQRPVQLALPVPVTRVRKVAAPPPAAAPARPRVRSRQLMFPGMPTRPVPHRQLSLWIDPPKHRRSK